MNMLLFLGDFGNLWGNKMGYPCAPLGFDVVWPQKGHVPADKLKLWYWDAVANGQCPNGARKLVAKAWALHQAGLITLKMTPELKEFFESKTA